MTVVPLTNTARRLIGVGLTAARRASARPAKIVALFAEQACSNERVRPHTHVVGESSDGVEREIWVKNHF